MRKAYVNTPWASQATLTAATPYGTGNVYGPNMVWNLMNLTDDYRFLLDKLAILHEKDKEFVQEGQRWWDLRRMTLTKGGKHLVFTPEGSIDENPILNEATEAHKVLWPLDKGLLDNDDALEQTPGY